MTEYAIFIAAEGRWKLHLITKSRTEADYELRYLTQTLGVKAGLFQRQR